MASGRSYLQRPIPLAMIILVAVVIHGPLLLMELPASTSYDANLHIFFGSHYAQHWFDPWNEKWFAGFSQTTYPPLTHQWIALLSHLVGLTEAFMLVQLVAIILLAVGTCRWLSKIRFGLRSSRSRFELCPSKSRESPYSSRVADGRS